MMNHKINSRLLALAALLNETLKPELVDFWKNKPELSQYNKYLEKEPMEKHSLLKQFKIELPADMAAYFANNTISRPNSSSNKTAGGRYLQYLGEALSTLKNDIIDYTTNERTINDPKVIDVLLSLDKAIFAISKIRFNKGMIPPSIGNAWIIDVEKTNIFKDGKTQIVQVINLLRNAVRDILKFDAFKALFTITPPAFYDEILSIETGATRLYLVGSTDPNDVLTMSSRGYETDSCMNLFKTHQLPRIVANLFDTHSMIIYITNEDKTALTGASSKNPYGGPKEWNKILGRSILRVIEAPNGKHFLFLDNWYGANEEFIAPQYIRNIIQQQFGEKIYISTDMDSIKTEIIQIYNELNQDMPDLLVPQKNIPLDDEVQLAPVYNDTWTGASAELKPGGRFTYVNSLGELLELIGTEKDQNVLSKYYAMFNKTVAGVKLAFENYFNKFFSKDGLNPSISVQVNVSDIDIDERCKLMVKINIQGYGISWNIDMNAEVSKNEPGQWVTPEELQVYPFKFDWTISNYDVNVESVDADWNANTSDELASKLRDSISKNVYKSLQTLAATMKQLKGTK